METMEISMRDELRIGLVSVSDRASAGVYRDEGIPALEDFFTRALTTPWTMETRLVPDERTLIETTLVQLVDSAGCDLVLTTGGTGPAIGEVRLLSLRPAAEDLVDGEELHGRELLRVPDGYLGIARPVLVPACDVLAFGRIKILEVGGGLPARALFVHHLVHHAHRRLGEN